MRPVSGPLVPPAVSGFGRPPGYETLETLHGPATALLLAGSVIPGQPFAVVMTWLCATGIRQPKDVDSGPVTGRAD